jgi:hypothetical protein
VQEGIFKKAGIMTNQTKSWFGRIVVSGSLALLIGIVLFLSAAASATSTTSTTSASGGRNDKAVITGSLRIFGGTAKAPRSGTPVAGRVVFKPTRGAEHALKVGESGEFKIALDGGSYKVFGGPPAWGNECLVNGGKPFEVKAGQSLKVVVACTAL